MSGQGAPSFKMDAKVWEDFLGYLEQAQRSQLNNGLASEAAAIDLEAQSTPSIAPKTCNTKTAEATHLLALCRLEEQKGVVVLSSDSETDDDTIWSNSAKCKGYRRLWEKARSLAFHRLIPSFHYKNSTRGSFFYATADEQLFPYNKLKELSEELRKFQLDFVHNQEELDFLWNNVLQWLLALKQSMDPMDLKYDEKLNLILIDFMVQYINYMTQKSCKIAVESEIYEKVNKIVHTLGVILSGNALHAIMVLLRIELKLEYRSLLDPIFRKYLTDRCLCQPSTDLVFYLRVIFCFKRWKIITPLKADREAINNLAVGKSLRKLRDKCSNDVHDLTTESILPKSVPKVNVKNKLFISISDLIGFAIERKAIGTRILLVYTSLDLDDAISKYLRFYERYVSSYPDSHTANISAFAVRETLLPQTMDVTAVTERINKDAIPCQPHRKGEQQNAAQPIVSEHQLNCYSPHFNSNCDKNKTRLSYSPNCNVSTFSRKTANTESDISLSSLSNNFNNNLETIEIDLTDNDENENSKSLKSPPIRNFSPQLELKTSKAQMTYSRLHRNKGQLEKSKITTELKTYSNEQNSTITLTSSSSSDDENSLVNYLKNSDSDAASRQNIVLNENAIGFEQSIPRIAAVPPRCRPLVESVATKPTRKEKHCIPGEVSSTTSPDCMLQPTNALRTPATPEQASTSSTFQYNNLSNLEVHSAGILQNAREVGIVKAVQQRVSPCPPVVVSGTCKPGSLLLGIDYSDVSSESEDLDSDCESHLMSRGSWKVVEEATSSTVEFPKNFTENIVFSIRNERTKVKSKMSPSHKIPEAENEQLLTHQSAPECALDECHIPIDEPMCSKNIGKNHTEQTAILTSVQKCPLENANIIKAHLEEPIVTNSLLKSAEKTPVLINFTENKNIDTENLTENSEIKSTVTERKECELSFLDHANNDNISIPDQLDAENNLVLGDKSPCIEPSENTIKVTEVIPENLAKNENQPSSQHKEADAEEESENKSATLSTPSEESIAAENEEENNSNRITTLESSNISMHCILPSPVASLDKKTLLSGLEETFNENNTNCKNVELTTKTVPTTVKTNSLKQCESLSNELQTKHLVKEMDKISDINMLPKEQSNNAVLSAEAADIESFLKEIDDNLRETVSSAMAGQQKVEGKKKIVGNTSKNDDVTCKINEHISEETKNTQFTCELHNESKKIISSTKNIDPVEKLKCSKNQTVSSKEKTNEIFATKDKNMTAKPVGKSNIPLKCTKLSSQIKDSHVSTDNKSSTSTYEKLDINAKTDFSQTDEAKKTPDKNNEYVGEDHKIEFIKDSSVGTLNHLKSNNPTVNVGADVAKERVEKMVVPIMSETSISACEISDNIVLTHKMPDINATSKPLDGKAIHQQTIIDEINIESGPMLHKEQQDLREKKGNTNEKLKLLATSASSLASVDALANRMSSTEAVMEKISQEDHSDEAIESKEAEYMDFRINEICQADLYEQKTICQQSIIDQTNEVNTNENAELLTTNGRSLASFDDKTNRLSSFNAAIDKISLEDQSGETIRCIGAENVNFHIKKTCQADNNEQKQVLAIENTIVQNKMSLSSSKKQIKSLGIKKQIDDVLIEMAKLVLNEDDTNVFVGNNNSAEKTRPTSEKTNENIKLTNILDTNKNKAISSVEQKSNVIECSDDITIEKTIEDNRKQLSNVEQANSQSNEQSYAQQEATGLKEKNNLEKKNDLKKKNDFSSDTLDSRIKAKEMQESNRKQEITMISINKINVPDVHIDILDNNTNISQDIDNNKDDNERSLKNVIPNLQNLSHSQTIETDGPENMDFTILELENNKVSETDVIGDNIPHNKNDQIPSAEMTPLCVNVNTTCEADIATKKSSDMILNELNKPTRKIENKCPDAEMCILKTNQISVHIKSGNTTNFQEKLTKINQNDSHAPEENDVEKLIKKHEGKIHIKIPAGSIPEESKDNDLISGETSAALSFQIGSNKGDEIFNNITTIETMHKSSNLLQMSEDTLPPALTESLNCTNITDENKFNENQDIGQKENSIESVNIENINCLKSIEKNKSNLQVGAILLGNNSTLMSTEDVETENNTSKTIQMRKEDSTISDKNDDVTQRSEINSDKTEDTMQLQSSMISEKQNFEEKCETEFTKKCQQTIATDLKNVEIEELQETIVKNKSNVESANEKMTKFLDTIHEPNKLCGRETPLDVGKDETADSNNFDIAETMEGNVLKDLKEDELTLNNCNTIGVAEKRNFDKETRLYKPHNSMSVSIATKHRSLLNEDVEKRTPWKMRIKRRISLCSDINKEFNLDSDEEDKTEYLCNTLFVSDDNNLLSSPLASPNGGTAADELAANISKLDIKRKSTSSESDHSNADIDCVDFQGSWLRNLGLLKNTSKSHESPTVGSNENKSDLDNVEADNPPGKVSTKLNSEELVAITALVDMQNKCSNKNDSNAPDQEDNMQNAKVTAKGRRGRPSKSKLTPVCCSLKNIQSTDASKPLKTILKSLSNSKTIIKKKVTYDEASILALEKTIESRKAKKAFENMKVKRYEEGSLLKGTNNNYTKKRLAKINLRFKLETHQKYDEKVDCSEINNLKETTLALTPVTTEIPTCLPERKELESTVSRLMERVQSQIDNNKLTTVSTSKSEDTALLRTLAQKTDEIIKPRRGRKRKIDKILTQDIKNKPSTSVLKNDPVSKKTFIKKNTEQEVSANIIYPVLLTSGNVGETVTEKCTELPLTADLVEPQTTSCQSKPLKSRKKQSNKPYAIAKDQLIVPDEVNSIKRLNSYKNIDSEMELQKCMLEEVKQNTVLDHATSIKAKQTTESNVVHLGSQSFNMKKAFVRLKRIEIPNQKPTSSKLEQIQTLSTNTLIQESEIKKEPVEETVATNTSSIDISIKIKEELIDIGDLDLQYPDLTQTESNGNSNKFQCKEIIVRPCDVILTADIINAQASHITEIAKNRKNLRNRNTSRLDSPILTNNIERKDMRSSTPTSKRQETVPALAELEKNEICELNHYPKNKNFSGNIKKKTIARKDIEVTQTAVDAINIPDGENNQLLNDPKCISTENSMKNSPELSNECDKSLSKANQRRKNKNRIEVVQTPELCKNVIDEEINKQLANDSKCVSTEKSAKTIPELSKERDKNQKISKANLGRKNSKAIEAPETPGEKINVSNGKSNKQLPIDSKCVSTEKTIENVQSKECDARKKLSKTNQERKNINAGTSSEKSLRNKNELIVTNCISNQKEDSSDSLAENNKMLKSSKDILASSKTIKPDIEIKQILSPVNEKDTKICKLNPELNEKAIENLERQSQLKKKAKATLKVDKTVSKQKSEQKTAPEESSRIEIKTECEKKPANDDNQEAKLCLDLKNKNKIELLVEECSNKKKEPRSEENITLKETQKDEKIVSNKESTKELPMKEICTVGMEADSKDKKICYLNQNSNKKDIENTDDSENKVHDSLIEQQKFYKNAEKTTVKMIPELSKERDKNQKISKANQVRKNSKGIEGPETPADKMNKQLLIDSKCVSTENTVENVQSKECDRSKQLSKTNQDRIHINADTSTEKSIRNKNKLIVTSSISNEKEDKRIKNKLIVTSSISNQKEDNSGCLAENNKTLKSSKDNLASCKTVKPEIKIKQILSTVNEKDTKICKLNLELNEKATEDLERKSQLKKKAKETLKVEKTVCKQKSDRKTAPNESSRIETKSECEQKPANDDNQEAELCQELKNKNKSKLLVEESSNKKKEPRSEENITLKDTQRDENIVSNKESTKELSMKEKCTADMEVDSKDKKLCNLNQNSNKKDIENTDKEYDSENKVQESLIEQHKFSKNAEKTTELHELSKKVAKSINKQKSPQENKVDKFDQEVINKKSSGIVGEVCPNNKNKLLRDENIVSEDASHKQVLDNLKDKCSKGEEGAIKTKNVPESANKKKLDEKRRDETALKIVIKTNNIRSAANKSLRKVDQTLNVKAIEKICMELKATKTSQDEKNVSEEKGVLNVGRKKMENKVSQDPKNKQIENTLNEDKKEVLATSLRDEYSFSKEGNDLELTTDDSFRIVSETTDKQESLKKNKEYKLDQNLNNKTSSALIEKVGLKNKTELLLGNDNADTENHKNVQIVNEEKNTKTISKTLIEKKIISTTTQGESNEDSKHTETPAENINKDFYLEKEDKVAIDTVSDKKAISNEKKLSDTFKEKEVIGIIEKVVPAPKNVEDCSKNVGSEAAKACNVTHHAILEQADENITDCVIAELKLLSPQNILLKQDKTDLDPDVEIAKKLDQGIEMVLGSKNENKSSEQNVETNVADDKEQKTAELLDSAIEKVLGNYLPANRTNKLAQATLQEVNKHSYKPKTTTEHLDFAIDAILGQKNAPKNITEAEKKILSPAKRKLGVLTAEKINSSLEKLLENNRKNDLEHQTAETLNQSIEKILGQRITSGQNVESKTAPVAITEISPKKIVSNTEEPPTKKAMNKKYFTDMKIVSAFVPEALFADDDSDNSNSEESTSPDNLKFFTPILSLDDLLNKKTDQLLQIPTCSEGNDFSCEQETADETDESRQCLGTPNFSVELEVETSKKGKKFPPEDNTTSDVIKNDNDISVMAENDQEKLTNSLEETNTTNLENFVLSSISDIPIDFNMSNESFPDVMDIMLLDQVQQSIDCVISGNNFAQKWSQNSYTGHESLQNQIEKSKKKEIVQIITPSSEHNICISQILDSSTTVANASCPTSIDIGQEILYSSINPLDEVEVSTNIGFDLVGNVTVEDLLANDGDDLFAFSELDKTRSRSNSLSNDSENYSSSTNEETGNIAQKTKAIACDHSYNKEIKATEADKSISDLTNFPKPVRTEVQNYPTPSKTKGAKINKSPHYNFTKLKSHPAPYWKVKKVDDVKTSTPKRDFSMEEQAHVARVTKTCHNAADLVNVKLEKNLAKKNLFCNMPELDIGTSKVADSETEDLNGISIISSTDTQEESVGNSAVTTIPAKQLDSVDIFPTTSFEMPSKMEIESSVDIQTSISSEGASFDVHASTNSEIIVPGKPIVSVDVNSRISTEIIASSNQKEPASIYQNIPSERDVFPTDTFDIKSSKLSAIANQVESDNINTVSNVVASANQVKMDTLFSSETTGVVYQVESSNIQSRRSSEIPTSASQEQSDGNGTSLPSEVLAPITQADLIEIIAPEISTPASEIKALDFNPNTSDPSTEQEDPIVVPAVVPKRVRLEITEMITIVAPSPISHETVSTTSTTASEPNSPAQQEKTSSRSSTPVEITEVITIPAHSLITQPIITIQSQTNRLQRVDPIPNQELERHDYTPQALGSNSTPLSSHRETTPTLDELTKEDEEEETTFENQQLNNDLSRDSEKKYGNNKTLKRANTPTLDEPPEKKPCLDEDSKKLPLDNVFDKLKQESPVNHAVCKKLFKKIDTSDESDETPQCDTFLNKYEESKVENSIIGSQKCASESIETALDSKRENPDPLKKPTQTRDDNSFQMITIESSTQVCKSTLKDSAVNVKGNEEVLVKNNLSSSTSLLSSPTSNKLNSLVSTNSKPKSISDLPKIAKIKEKSTENLLNIAISNKDKVTTELVQFNKASNNGKKTTIVSPLTKNTTSPSTSKSVEVNNRMHPQHHLPDGPQANRNKYSYQRSINSSEAPKLNSFPKSTPHKPTVKSIFEQKQHQNLTNSVYKCVPSMPNTQRTTASTPTINAANIKLSAAAEAEVKMKLEAYQKTLPATKIYKEHREQLRLLKLQEEKLRLEYLEREKRKQAEKLKIEAAQRLKRKSQNDSFESHYKRFALASSSRASSSQSHSSQIQQHSHHSQQKPHHSQQQYHRPAHTRQVYVNKFGEIEKKIASSRGCKESAPSKTPLTITTAWEHKSTSVDEIIEHLAKMKKP